MTSRAELPSGPRAPAAWQTLGWMVRPAAFLQRAHERFGDPVTIRTYWTDEPMVLFSGPGAVRDIFRLDPAIAPAGQSWEFLRPFAGEHSILLLDGEEHLCERRVLQTPFHGERMRAFRPMVAELAEREIAAWSGRVITHERMRQLTLETILRVVFGARDEEAVRLREAVNETFGIVRSMPRMVAMALVQHDLGPRSPWGRFRVAVERFDELLLGLVERRRREPPGDSMLALLLEQRDADGNPPSDRHLRDQLVALLAAGHDTSAASLSWAFERLARHPDAQARLRDGDERYLDAVVKEVLRVRPALTIAPRRLLEPVSIAGRRLPAGVQVAACLWLAMRRDDLWHEAGAFRPERWLEGAAPPDPMSWIPFGGGVRRCAGAPFAEMEMREVLRAASGLTIRPVRAESERARRSGVVVTPHRGGEVIVERA